MDSDFIDLEEVRDSAWNPLPGISNIIGTMGQVLSGQVLEGRAHFLQLAERLC